MDRAEIVHSNFERRVAAGDFPAGNAPDASLTKADAARLFRAQCLSRALDRTSRAMQKAGTGFYTIGSSGHEGLAAVAHALRPTDMAFLHYRDAAFQIARADQVPGQQIAWDMLLSFACSSEDPISGGRHKVLGSKALMIPPQTSTIASHLPKAVGAAYSIGLAKRRAPEHQLLPQDAIIMCSFGDASVNHSTAQGAINTACWTSYQSIPLPLLFVCEDNGIGISTKTPKGWVAANYRNRPDLKYFYADGLDMFETARVEDDAIPEGAVTAEEARQRQRFTRLFELVQHKGESECDNRLGWTEDEFCGFEKLPYDSFGGKNTGDSGGTLFKLADFFIDESDLPATQLPEPSNYLRYALKKGLQQRAELGVNSFKYGLIGSTDTHIAAPGMTAEKNHPAHGGAGMGARGELPKGLPDEIEFGPGGLAVLWAEENTRDSLYAAMQRREAYATSGTRPTLRFFGGWDYAANLCDRPDLVEQGYAGGVPMGGDMPARPGDANPTFAVLAMQDPGSDSIEGIPLQRAQIIKGWYQNGELHEQVLDVAGGANDATVDTTTCERSGVGHRSLCTVWEDKNFRADAQAFYYVRVLENPSCRWSQYYCNDAGVQCDDPATISEGMEGCCAAEHQPVIQERAWSSPIWYTPAS